jgi:hypothetical protein
MSSISRLGFFDLYTFHLYRVYRQKKMFHHQAVSPPILTPRSFTSKPRRKPKAYNNLPNTTQLSIHHVPSKVPSLYILHVSTSSVEAISLTRAVRRSAGAGSTPFHNTVHENEPPAVLVVQCLASGLAPKILRLSWLTHQSLL